MRILVICIFLTFFGVPTAFADSVRAVNFILQPEATLRQGATGESIEDFEFKYDLNTYATALMIVNQFTTGKKIIKYSRDAEKADWIFCIKLDLEAEDSRKVMQDIADVLKKLKPKFGKFTAFTNETCL